MPNIPLYIAVSNAICDKPNPSLLQQVRQQIDQSSEKLQKDDLNRALRLAVTIDDVDTAKDNIDYLIAKGANVNAVFDVAGYKYGITQLTTSDHKPLHPEIIKHLNDNGADFDIGTKPTPKKPG